MIQTKLLSTSNKQSGYFFSLVNIFKTHSTRLVQIWNSSKFSYSLAEVQKNTLKVWQLSNPSNQVIPLKHSVVFVPFRSPFEQTIHQYVCAPPYPCQT